MKISVNKIAIIGSILLVIGLGYFFSKPSVGATLPVAGQTYTLAGSGTTGSATSITLSSLTIPQTGYELVDSNFSDTFYITFEPGSRQRQEIASCTTVVQNANNTATLSGCTRGLLPFTPFTASSSYQFAHGGGTSVIFSDPPQLFNQFLAADNAATITGVYTFSTSSIPRLSGSHTYAGGEEEYLVTYRQLASTSFSGTVDASLTQKGISELATGEQASQMAGVGTGDTTAPLVLHTGISTSTGPGAGGVAGYHLVVTDSDGYLSSSFGGKAFGIANLDGNQKVYQNPQSAQVTSTFSRMPLTSATTSTLHGSWFGTSTVGSVFYVGSDGYASALVPGTARQVLRLNSGATAPEWGGATKLSATTTNKTGSGSNEVEFSVASSTISGGLLSTGNIIRLKAFLSAFNLSSGTSSFRLYYDNTLVAEGPSGAITTPESKGWVEGTLYASGSTTAQEGQVTGILGGNSTSTVLIYGVGTGAEDSSTDKVLDLRLWCATSATCGATTANSYVELVQ